MKQLLSAFAFFALHLHASSQCSDCHSLEEALKDPSRVRHLDLSNQGLTQLPDSVRYMTQLETIDLSQNYFTTVDLNGAQLPQVWRLDLSGNIGLDPLELKTIATAFPNLLDLDLSDAKLAYLTADIGAARRSPRCGGRRSPATRSAPSSGGTPSGTGGRRASNCTTTRPTRTSGPTWRPTRSTRRR
jgi:Leucine-rich repeat (LRR) protein